ncbi:MAG: glycosyltransferase family 4 protein [Candidatus Omnitrophota bacterium]|jgi:glycosyltransferase involved in cell wall biosynthesis|nr:MAG: glycosyltransferase family 4 protein [Candidatus Omnitrophota bacterium]
MKICYIGDGDSIHNHFMVDWFQHKGHEILFLTDTPEHAPPCEVRQVAPRHGLGPLRHLYAAANVRKHIQEWKPDILHAHNVTGYGYWAALSNFKPLVMTAWGTDLNVLAQKNPLIRSLVSFSLRRAKLITADAKALCETARKLAGKKADVRLLQWGVDLTDFEQPISSENRDSFRADADFVFLSTRRLRFLYNIDFIIRAFAQVLPRFPRSRLVVVGDDLLLTQFKKLANELGIQDRILFTGWVGRKRLIAALLSADAFLSVPSTDSTALSLLEAFAARLPVILSDLPANREWIEHGKNGLLVPPKDVEALAQAMIYMKSNEEEIKRWGKINRGIVEESGNREKEMVQLTKWYEEFIRIT